MLPYYSFPHEAAIHVNGMVVLFSAAMALLTGFFLEFRRLGNFPSPSSGR